MAKAFSYNYERMLELLTIERACVRRASGLEENEGPCDRDCANCPLVQKTEDLLDMYDKVIRLVSREVGRVKREKGYKNHNRKKTATEKIRKMWKGLRSQIL